MLSLEEFEEAAIEIAGTFPEDFFRELNGGVMVREQSRLHPAAEDHDLFVMGEYHLDRYLGRFIVLYYGSFVRCFGDCTEEALRGQIRRVLLHEFRHHLESLAGERDLEIEDAAEISRYRRRRAELAEREAGRPAREGAGQPAGEGAGEPARKDIRQPAGEGAGGKDIRQPAGEDVLQPAPEEAP